MFFWVCRKTFGARNMWDKLGAIVGLVIGVCLIIFRKRVRSLYLKKQFEEHTTPKRIVYQQQMKEMKLEGIFYKALEIISIAVGVLLILMSAAEFFPQADQYIGYFIAYSLLAFFAACAAGLVELKFIAPFLMRNIHKYTRERYDNWYQSVQSPSKNDKLNAVRSEPTDNLVLRALQRKAFIYLVVCFVVLFVILLFAFYTIFILTS